MNIIEVIKWKPFVDVKGTIWDLSFLNAHEVIYIHQSEGKADLEYRFFVTYSMHCFTKEYVSQSRDEKNALMYRSTKEGRPFCKIRYELAKCYLKKTIISLNEQVIFHAGYGSYAIIETLNEQNEVCYYYVPFKVFREKKKFRIHVTSAYPVDSKPRGGKVKFFRISHNLVNGKKLPSPLK
jgi:hypothetical protein